MKTWLLPCLLLAALPASADVAGVPRVIDGDTLQIGEARVRLWGIDAPEGKQSCQRDGVAWLCGQEAGLFLRSLIDGQAVVCVERDKDQYGRIVGQCSLPDGRDLGAVMVSSGMALAYRRYGGDLYSGEEAKAKADRRGLWAGKFSPPWEWRKTR